MKNAEANQGCENETSDAKTTHNDKCKNILSIPITGEGRFPPPLLPMLRRSTQQQLIIHRLKSAREGKVRKNFRASLLNLLKRRTIVRRRWWRGGRGRWRRIGGSGRHRWEIVVDVVLHFTRKDKRWSHGRKVHRHALIRIWRMLFLLFLLLLLWMTPRRH